MYEHKNGVVLRKLESDHLYRMADMKSHSWTTQHQSVLLNEDDQQRFFSRVSASARDYYLIAEDVSEEADRLISNGVSPNYIGVVNVCNIDWISRCADVGMMAEPDVRGTSLTAKLPEAVTDFAFEFLNLNRLQAEVLDNNPAALKFDLGLGYKIEGRRRQAVNKCGVYHDSILIAMLRDEWAASDRVKNYGGICNRNYKARKPIDRLIAKMVKE